jgi:hypothetical protein
VVKRIARRAEGAACAPIDVAKQPDRLARMTEVQRHDGVAITGDLVEPARDAARTAGALGSQHPLLTRLLTSPLELKEQAGRDRL